MNLMDILRVLLMVFGILAAGFILVPLFGGRFGARKPQRNTIKASERWVPGSCISREE